MVVSFNALKYTGFNADDDPCILSRVFPYDNSVTQFRYTGKARRQFPAAAGPWRATVELARLDRNIAFRHFFNYELPVPRRAILAKEFLTRRAQRAVQREVHDVWKSPCRAAFIDSVTDPGGKVIQHLTFARDKVAMHFTWVLPNGIKIAGPQGSYQAAARDRHFVFESFKKGWSLSAVRAYIDSRKGLSQAPKRTPADVARLRAQLQEDIRIATLARVVR